MTKKYTITILTLMMLAALLLAACGGNEPAATEDPASQEEQINMIYTQAAETLQAEIALTEEAQPQPTDTPEPSPTTVVLPTNTLPSGEETATPLPTLPSLPTSTPIPTKPPVSGGRPCLRAEMLFESPADGRSMSTGNSFIKYWQFANSGDCTWNENFALVHVGGPNFTDSGTLNLVDISDMGDEGVPNGGSINIEISMEAPSTPGSYRSYWMFRDDNGQLFGIGSLGDEVLWVDILVKDN